MINRKNTRQVKVGRVLIGGGADISIQSMIKSRTRDVKACISEANRLKDAGCEIIRVAIKDTSDAEAVKKIKRCIDMPLVCDIHFNYALALASIKNGADKIRLNPGNIGDRDEIAQVIKAARRARIPIRIGINSGSFDDRKWKKENGKKKNNNPSSIFYSPSSRLVRSAIDYIKLFERMDFHDIILSLKASDVVTTVDAYRQIAKRCDYPLHLGVTAAGPYDSGIVKSSIGIGALLLDGIGDTIRVSLTADPVEEVIAAKRILSSLGLRRFGPEIISCPTCGRCQVDLTSIVKELERKLTTYCLPLTTKAQLTIAIMGCEVNGPGEARGADIGIAFGKGSGMLFKDGKIIKKVKAKTAVSELVRLLYAIR